MSEQQNVYVCPRCGRKDGEAIDLEIVKKYKGSIFHHINFIDKPSALEPTLPNWNAHQTWSEPPLEF